MLIALFVVPPLRNVPVNSFSVYNALQSFAALGLVALALGLTMIVGEFDLSVVGTYALGGMIAVKFGVHHPVLGILCALLVCAAFGLVQGLLVAHLGINSMAVTLGGYLASLGLTGTISNNKSIPFSNYAFSGRLNQPIASILSLKIVVALVAMAVVAVVVMGTTLGRNMRATGGGRRASRTAGVRVNLMVVGAFVASAVLSALGGSLQSFGVATATANPGLSPLIFAVTATLLGGIALSGGRGNPLGIIAGGIGLCFFAQLFTTLASPQYTVSLLTGGLLIVVTVFSTTNTARRAQLLRSPLVTRLRTKKATS
nr:ABC transporter permease [Allobranchiibius sp. GilTou38]